MAEVEILNALAPKRQFKPAALKYFSAAFTPKEHTGIVFLYVLTAWVGLQKNHSREIYIM